MMLKQSVGRRSFMFMLGRAMMVASFTLFALAVWLSSAPVPPGLRVVIDIVATLLALAVAGLTVGGWSWVRRIAGLEWIASRRARSP